MNSFSIKNEICEKDRKHIFVCGHSGSGKSTFSKMLAKELGYTYVNVDWLSLDICHEEDFLKMANKEIKDYIYDDMGNLLKKFEIMCQVLYKRNELAKNTAKVFFDTVEQKIRKCQEEPCVIDWFGLPLLDIWKSNAVKILVTVTDHNERINRILMRKKISDEMLRERERASVQYEEQEYDIVLKNDKNLEELTKLTMDIVEFLKEGEGNGR